MNTSDKLDYLIEMMELEEANEITGPVFSSIKAAAIRIMKEKLKAERSDKLTRSRLQLFNVGTKIWDFKKKVKDKQVKDLLDQIVHAFHIVANDKRFQGEK